MKRFLIALQFLTTVPIRIRGTVKARDIGASLRYFPIVGLIIGLLLAGVSSLSLFLPSTVAAAIVLVVLLLITGCLHVDGLADSCDGLYGVRSKEDRLRIMRDSRTGAMGVAAITISLLLRYAIISEFSFNEFWKALVVMAVCGRWAQVFGCFSAPYARTQGTAQDFITHVGKTEIVYATVTAVAIVGFLMHASGLVIFGVQVLSACAFIQFCKRKISGMTGDTIGALNEFTEIVVLVCVVISKGIFYGGY